MKNFLVSVSYYLEASKSYNKTKKFTYNILENHSSTYKKIFDFFMIFLVLSTIAILIYEVNHIKLPLLDSYETFAIMIFIIEWLGRLWVSSDIHRTILNDYEHAQVLDKAFDLNRSIKSIIKTKADFIFSPMSIIDLLAILPYYRPLRILRIFLLFRLFKILRYTNSLKQFTIVFKERKFELYTLAILYVMVVFFGATIMFIYEGSGANDKIHGFFDAVYWSIITISTVGYGDVTPVTVEGKLVTLVLIISGFLVIAFGTSIITTGLAERMENIKEERVEAEAAKMDNFTIICGFGVMGRVLAGELNKINNKFIIIDINEENIKKAKSRGFLAIRGDATNMHLLEEIGINTGAVNIIALTNDDAVNLSIILSAKTLNPNINIIARANATASIAKFEIAGVTKVMSANEISSYVAAEYIGQPVAFEAIDDILLNDEAGACVDEIEVLDNSKNIGKKVKDIDISKYNLSLIGIIDSNDRKNFIFNPLNSDYEIKQKDIFIVIGYAASIAELKIDLISKSLEG